MPVGTRWSSIPGADGEGKMSHFPGREESGGVVGVGERAGGGGGGP